MKVRHHVRRISAESAELDHNLPPRVSIWLLAVLGVAIATALLGRESRSPELHRLFGAPVGSFALLVTLSALLGAAVVALIWIDYGQHRRDEQAHRVLEEEVARRTEQLLHANEQLQEMDRIKTELVHRVSHELRTPLTSINGYTEVLLDRKAGEINEVQEEFLRTVADNAARLQGLVDDVLDISRWEAGTQRMARDNVALTRTASRLGGIRLSLPSAARRRPASAAPVATPFREARRARTRAIWCPGRLGSRRMMSGA